MAPRYKQVKNPIIIDVAWLMRDLAQGRLGKINWERLATRLYTEGYICETRERKRDVPDKQDGV